MERHHKQLIIEAKRKYTKRNNPTWSDREVEWFAFYDKTDNSANGLTSCVVDFLKFSGHQAERINTTGTARAKYKIDPHTRRRIGNAIGVTWTKGGATLGSADISSTIAVNIAGQIIGLSVKWEVKFGRDRQSDKQKEYEVSIASAGGYYFIIKDFSDFIGYYNALMAKFSN